MPPITLFNAFFLATACLLFQPATAGISYSLDQTQAAAGEAVRVRAVLYNDTDEVLDWTAPETLVLQWRDASGQAIRTLAHLETGRKRVHVPVNNFVKFAWRAIVPSAARGLQAMSIEGTPALLALDTSSLEPSPITGTPARVPVVQAGKGADHGQHHDPAVPAEIVAASGASPAEGPPVQTAYAQAPPRSPFENFTNVILPYEPVYFALGNDGGTDARMQISFKYRLFTPEDANRPRAWESLYLGYTQQALWDLHGDSKPFIDTTYNPSLFWHRDKLWESSSHRWFAGLSTGVEHKSNGKSGEDSRSFNDVYVEPQLNYRFPGGSTLSFTPRFKAYFAADDHDYKGTLGHVDWKLRWAQDNGLVLSGLYRQGTRGRYGAQIDAAWPLRRTFLNMNGYLYAQYFRGYGETLLGYDHKSGPQVRVGLALVP